MFTRSSFKIRFIILFTDTHPHPVMRPPVWIIILFTFIETFVFVWDLRVHAAEVLACYGTDHTCAFFSMQCSNDDRIDVEKLQYGLTVGAGMSCQSDTRLNCTDEKNICCAKESDKCIVDFPQHEAESVRNNCSGKPSCGPIRANRIQFNTSHDCKGNVSNYVIVNYSCGPGTDTTVQLTSTMSGLSSSGNKSSSSGTDTTVQLTSTTNGLSSSGNKASSSGTGTTVQLTSTTNGLSSSGNKSSSSGPSTTTPGPVATASNIMTSTSTLSTRVSSSDNQTNPGLTSTSLNDAEQHPERLIIIVVVVVAVLVLSAILVIVFILHRRRCKKSSQEDAPRNQLPDVLINHSNMNFGGRDQDYKAVESPNYDEMNDESSATYSRPVKKKKDDSTIAIDEKKTGGNCATDEYDRIEFAKKYPVKMTNYDSVSATEVKKVDDTYSHVSSQWKPASAAATNDYSHCQFIRHESKSNDDTNKTAVSNEPLIADNYSHVDLNAEKTKIRPSNIIEEDSYNPNELDKTTNPPRNGHAVNVRTIAKSEEGSQTFKDLQSLGAENDGWPICDRNSGVSSQDQPLQDVKAISLPDKYIEFKIGDIYDTPRCKDQQYNVVLKGNKEQLLNRIETGSKRKSETEDNNGVIEDCAVRSDYELAKPIDF